MNSSNPSRPPASPPGVKSQAVGGKSLRPAPTINQVDQLIQSFATDSDSKIVNQDQIKYLNQAHEIIQAAERNRSRCGESYSYACYKQAIIIMLSITQGMGDSKDLIQFSLEEEPGQLFSKLLNHYSSSDKASKDICISVFHVAHRMVTSTRSDAKNGCKNRRCMNVKCSKDAEIRNEILQEFLKEDTPLDALLKKFFDQGLTSVLNDSQPPSPHPDPRPATSTQPPAPTKTAPTKTAPTKTAPTNQGRNPCCAIS